MSHLIEQAREAVKQGTSAPSALMESVARSQKFETWRLNPHLVEVEAHGHSLVFDDFFGPASGKGTLELCTDVPTTRRLLASRGVAVPPTEVFPTRTTASIRRFVQTCAEPVIAYRLHDEDSRVKLQAESFPKQWNEFAPDRKTGPTDPVVLECADLGREITVTMAFGVIIPQETDLDPQVRDLVERAAAALPGKVVCEFHVGLRDDGQVWVTEIDAHLSSWDADPFQDGCIDLAKHILDGEVTLANRWGTDSQ